MLSVSIGIQRNSLKSFIAHRIMLHSDSFRDHCGQLGRNLLSLQRLVLIVCYECHGKTTQFPRAFIAGLTIARYAK